MPLLGSLVGVVNEAQQYFSGKATNERLETLMEAVNSKGGYKSAEFVIALAKEPGVVDTKFLSGAQELKSASAALSALKSSFPFPDDSEARVVRRGVLSCSEFSKGCVFVFYPADVAARPLLGIPLDQQ
jgi:hypothetical protein